MDFNDTPSGSDSDIESIETVESLHHLDIEELDEIEYALPTSTAPTLAEVLCAEEEETEIIKIQKHDEEPTSCSALQVDLLQAVSQQLAQAQERSFAGAPTALSVGSDGKISVGTAHGHLLTFLEQTLRWVCDSNTDKGAISCLAFNKDNTRLLAGYARGLLCQYESTRGTILRHITLGGEIWGTLKVTWAGNSGLALDTGGSVWLIKFSRPLGVRSTRTSCLFSGARGEVVAMAPRDARILALATLLRVIIVAGGHAAGLRISGPSDSLPVLEWSETDERILICAHATTMQWLLMNINGSLISLKPIKRVELKSIPIWMGWLGGNIAIFGTDENLRLWGENYDKPLDLSYIEPVYASAFFKGHWTDGRVSKAMCKAGASAMDGICVVGGACVVLGRRGVVRVRVRDTLTRAHAFYASGRHLHALRLLNSTQGSAAKELAIQFINNMTQRPHILSNKQIADLAVKLCLKFDLNEELWNVMWEKCSNENVFVEALGDAAVRGELSTVPPSPDASQALIERLAEFEPELVERVVASLPLMSLDPHRASVFTREKGLWRAVAAIASALGGCGCAMRELMAHVDAECAQRRRRGAGVCQCAGAALAVAAADALAGRAAGGRPLPAHARPSARHDALVALLTPEEAHGGRSPLQVLVEHEAGAGVRLLEQCARDPPFAGPLGKQNRLKVARTLLSFAHSLPEPEDRIEILEFLTGQLNEGALPTDQEAIDGLLELATITEGERADRAWLAALSRLRPNNEYLEIQKKVAEGRPRVLWRINVMLNHSEDAFQHFFKINSPSSIDIEEFFEYLRSQISDSKIKSLFEAYLPLLVNLRPKAVATLVKDDFDVAISSVINNSSVSEFILEFGEALMQLGHLSGEAATGHLKNLCILRPFDVGNFLTKNSGFIRPEEALAIVKELGPKDALPICLEATGDPKEALNTLLQLAKTSNSEELYNKYIAAAGELCSRVAPTVPPPVATEMWMQLLRTARSTPPALFLEAVSYLPVDETLGQNCDSPEIALMILTCAANRKESWECVGRIAGREAHGALARALSAARRGRAVRGECRHCGRRLADAATALAAHCGRAFHGECSVEPQCGACGLRLGAASATVALPTLPPRREPSAPSSEYTIDGLALTAPPRPDLEGIV